jgi:hypothetical protein
MAYENISNYSRRNLMKWEEDKFHKKRNNSKTAE